MKHHLGFADFTLTSSMKYIRSRKKMEKLNNAINLSRVDAILMNHYNIGTCVAGVDAYPPLLLFKCMLLQKWFRIDSDPELENQINDRLSFKKFLYLPLSQPYNIPHYGLKVQSSVDTPITDLSWPPP